MRRRAMKRVLVCGAFSVLLAVPVWATAGETTVQVGHNRLEPPEISIAAGDTVTFHNQDEMPGGHTLLADDGSFESPPWARTRPGLTPLHSRAPMHTTLSS